MPRKSKAERKVEKYKPQEKENRVINFKPKTINQSKFLRAIQSSHVTFCTGLPGTGKTFIAVAEACRMLAAKLIDKIIISRPIVETGERLGYLPGKLDEKAKPYLIPIFDTLKIFFSYQQIATMQNSGVLEIAPLAYMRGRTFNNAAVILDEAQNTDLKQLKMLLTRIGENSKIIVCGDTKQSDIGTDHLNSVIRALSGVDGISSITMREEDIVRHPLIAIIVQKIEQLETPRLPTRSFGSPNGNGHRLHPVG